MPSASSLLEHSEITKEDKRAYLFESPSILDIKGLSIVLREGKGMKEREIVKSLDLSIRPGEMIGLAGESGSGKSVTASAILGLLPKAFRIAEGSIFLNGMDLTNLTEKHMRKIRGRDIAYLFQNYQGSFTPFIKIGKQFIEAIRSHEKQGKQEAKSKAIYWLERVGLPAERIIDSYPYQLSGGELQRASIAASLMFKPSLIIADEPTTALDVLTGEKILDLLAEIQKELNCAVLLISHDLKHLLKRSDSLAVMYGGQIAEHGLTEKVCTNPQHPYTKLLFKARPILSRTAPKVLASIPGEPGLISENGCSFMLRCPIAVGECCQLPEMKQAGDLHWYACHVNSKKELL